jgi:hypothetical protein
LRYANLCTSFVQVAKLGSETEQAEAIARRHIREMKAEFVQLKKVRRKRAKSNTSTNAAHPTVPTSAHQHTTDPNAPQHTPRANAHQHTASRNAPQPTPRPNAHQQTADRSGPQPTSSSNAQQDTSVPHAQQQAAAPNVKHARPSAPTARKASSNVQQETLVPPVHQQPATSNAKRAAPSAPTTRQTRNASSLPKTSTSKRAKATGRNWFDTSAPTGQQTQPTGSSQQIPVEQTYASPQGVHVGPSPSTKFSGKQTEHTSSLPQSAAPLAPQHQGSANKQASVQGASSEQPSGGVVAPRDEPFVILNPPRSSTKGRKKSRIPSGIELQPKKMSLCGVCGQPGHNTATCTAALGNKDRQP